MRVQDLKTAGGLPSDTIPDLQHGTRTKMPEIDISKNGLLTVISFTLFYSQIEAASQSKKGLYFPNFGEFFPNLPIFGGFIPKVKRHRLYLQKGIKITDLSL